MSTSKIIAALLGPTLVATAAMVLLNLDAMSAIVDELSKSPMLIVLAGYAAFVPGLAIVYFHNRRTGGGPVLITVVGWLSLVIGLIRLVFPMQLAEIMAKFAPALLNVIPAVAATFLLIGGALSYRGGAERDEHGHLRRRQPLRRVSAVAHHGARKHRGADIV